MSLEQLCLSQITKISNPQQQKSISFICQDFLAQIDVPYSIFCEDTSVAVASVREVIASIKSVASQMSSWLEHFQSTHDTLFRSWNLAMANDLLTGSVCLFVSPGSISFSKISIT